MVVISDSVSCPIARLFVAAMSKRQVTSLSQTALASALKVGSIASIASSKKIGTKLFGHLYSSLLSSMLSYMISLGGTSPAIDKKQNSCYVALRALTIFCTYIQEEYKPYLSRKFKRSVH